MYDNAHARSRTVQPIGGNFKPDLTLKTCLVKPTRCTNISNLFFGIGLYMFRTVPLSIIRSFSLYTQQWYMTYSLRAGSGRNCSPVLILLTSCQQTCTTYTIAVCTLKKTPDDGQRNCPKHVEFHSKNKFEKLAHPVGFIITIYHNARSPERQIRLYFAAEHTVSQYNKYRLLRQPFFVCLPLCYILTS